MLLKLLRLSTQEISSCHSFKNYRNLESFPRIRIRRNHGFCVEKNTSKYVFVALSNLKSINCSTLHFLEDQGARDLKLDEPGSIMNSPKYGNLASFVCSSSSFPFHSFSSRLMRLLDCHFETILLPRSILLLIVLRDFLEVLFVCCLIFCGSLLLRDWSCFY